MIICDNCEDDHALHQELTQTRPYLDKKPPYSDADVYHPKCNLDLCVTCLDLMKAFEWERLEMRRHSQTQIRAIK